MTQVDFGQKSSFLFSFPLPSLSYILPHSLIKHLSLSLSYSSYFFLHPILLFPVIFSSFSYIHPLFFLLSFILLSLYLLCIPPLSHILSPFVFYVLSLSLLKPLPLFVMPSFFFLIDPPSLSYNSSPLSFLYSIIREKRNKNYFRIYQNLKCTELCHLSPAIYK